MVKVIKMLEKMVNQNARRRNLNQSQVILDKEENEN